MIRMSESIDRQVLLVGVIMCLVALSGCSAFSGDGEITGDVEVKISNVTVSDVEVVETDIMGENVTAVQATVSNNNEKAVEVRSEGTFYDSDGAEIETVTGCEEIDANTDHNGNLIATDRIEDADSYEVTLVDNGNAFCSVS
jgi:uncharacterized protein YcfL